MRGNQKAHLSQLRMQGVPDIGIAQYTQRSE
jgi:hypothetical protein